jgi:hypothetical protein
MARFLASLCGFSIEFLFWRHMIIGMLAFCSIIMGFGVFTFRLIACFIIDSLS